MELCNWPVLGSDNLTITVATQNKLCPCCISFCLLSRLVPSPASSTFPFHLLSSSSSSQFFSVRTPPSINRLMASPRPESPIKQTFMKLLSPTKPKPSPALNPKASEYRNSSYPESTSSSNYSKDSDNSNSKGGLTGWNVLERPQTPTFGPNKENIHVTPKQVVDHVMGRTSSKKLSKRNTKSTSVLKNPKHHGADLDRQFEELMVPLLNVRF